MSRLNQKTALVTGGAAGLGQAIAQRLAAEGARVVITDVDRNAGQATAQANGFTFLEQNVADEARWKEVVQEVESRFGQLNILVNNAGILGPREANSPENTTLASWKKIFEINVEGVFLGCRTALAAMRRADSGSIINMSSVAGLLATPYATAYGCSKAAVRQLTKSVAQYCAEQKMNVRCNSVHPGNVLTPLWQKSAEEMGRQRGVSQEQVIEEAKAGIPMGDFTRPEDIAAAVAFLASDDSRHMMGAEMIVDGGIIHCDSWRPPR